MMEEIKLPVSFEIERKENNKAVLSILLPTLEVSPYNYSLHPLLQNNNTIIAGEILRSCWGDCAKHGKRYYCIKKITIVAENEKELEKKIKEKIDTIVEILKNVKKKNLKLIQKTIFVELKTELTEKLTVLFEIKERYNINEERYEAEFAVYLPAKRSGLLQPILLSPKKILNEELGERWGTPTTKFGQNFRYNSTKIEAITLKGLRKKVEEKIEEITKILMEIKEINQTAPKKAKEYTKIVELL